MLFASQLYFKKSITTIPPMKNGVTFKPVAVSIMKQLTIQSLSIYTQVSHCHIFKEETKRV